MTIIGAGKEALWIAQFSAALEYRLPGQLISLRADNRGTISFTTNLEFYWHTKHIKMQYYQI